MISEPDRQLVARDPSLPGLQLLLDEDRLLEYVRNAWPDQPLDSLKCSYLRYKPGVNCLAGYVARTPAGGSLAFHAKARTAQHHAQLRPDDASRSLGEACIVLRRFPDDRELRGLPRLMLPERRSRLLRKILPDEPALWSARPDMLRYKPERRFVAGLHGVDEARALVKVYDKGDFENARRGATAFAGGDHLKVARQLGRSRRHRVIILQWLTGRSLDEWLRAPDFDPARMCEVGVALAELHRQTPDALARPGREDNALSVLVAANAAAWLHPALADPLRELAQRVAAQLLAEPATESTIHGDFNAEQVLWDADGIGIIDYDRACSGDPGADFGSFIARLEYEELAGLLPAGRIEEIGAGLLDGYCHRARCTRPARIELQVAAGLLRLMPHPFRNRDREWPERIEGLLQRADHALRADGRLRTIGPRALGGGRIAS
jgi:streptomycin 6-kinase